MSHPQGADSMVGNDGREDAIYNRHQEELKHQERGASRDLKITIGSSPVFGAYAEPITPK